MPSPLSIDEAVAMSTAASSRARACIVFSGTKSETDAAETGKAFGVFLSPKPKDSCGPAAASGALQLKPKEVPSSRDGLMEIRINRPQTAHGGHCCGSGLFIDPLGHPRASLGQKVKISFCHRSAALGWVENGHEHFCPR